MAVGQAYYNILDNNQERLISNITQTKLFTDVVAGVGASRFLKLGIQAPPGTQVVINQSKQIIIGRTGLYELDDEDIVITHLYFVQPKNYKRKDEESKQAMIDGANAMRAAELRRASRLAALGPMPAVGDANQTYWDAYSAIQSEYLNGYTTSDTPPVKVMGYDEALNTYEKGKNGIYELDLVNTKDLYNIVVDYIYE